jgi:hypothetical protein
VKRPVEHRRGEGAVASGGVYVTCRAQVVQAPGDNGRWARRGTCAVYTVKGATAIMDYNEEVADSVSSRAVKKQAD